MARTSRRKTHNVENAEKEFLQREYSEYTQEYFKNCKNSDFNGENVMTFDQWKIDFMESNY